MSTEHELPQDASPAPGEDALILLPAGNGGPNGQRDSRPLSPAAGGATTVPALPRAQRAFLRSLRKARKDTFFTERIARLRDAILLSTLGQEDATRGIVIGVSSPHGGEGVSLISLLLGTSLAECSSRRVAFLDGRLDPVRFGLLATAFNLAQNTGSIQDGFGDIVGYRNAESQNLCFLTSARSEGGMYFFSDKRLPAFFDSLRSAFDFCIVDMPPLLTDTVGLFALPHVDRLYLVAEAGRTRLAELGRAIELVEKVEREVSGVIVNKQRAPLWSGFLWRDFFF